MEREHCLFLENRDLSTGITQSQSNLVFFADRLGLPPSSAACYNRLEEERRVPIMEFFETVEKRASYRNAFAAQEIPEADIRKIVTAGLYAPSGYRFQLYPPVPV